MRFMSEVKKNTIIAAIYSFFIWGLGQMYASVSNFKIAVGILLMIGEFIYILAISIFFTNLLITSAIFIIIGSLVAIDAYRDSKIYNIQIAIKESEKKNIGNFCPYCGAKLEGYPKFCPYCGKKLV